MISNNTWVAVAQKAEAEARAKAEHAAARKSSSKRGSGRSTAKPAFDTAPTAKSALSATTGVPQVVGGAALAAAVQPAMPASLPNTRLKAGRATRA